MSVNGVSGGRVEIGWLGGDPSKPFAVAFDASNAVQAMVLAVLGQLFLGGQLGSEPPLKGLSYNALVATLLGELAIYAQAIQGIADPTGSATATLTTAINTFLGAVTGALATKVSVL